MMSPGFVAYVKMFPMKDGRSCSIVSMTTSYIFSWPLGENMDQIQYTVRCIYSLDKKCPPDCKCKTVLLFSSMNVLK